MSSQQQATDAIAAALALTQRIHVTAKQQVQDAANALASLERASELIKDTSPAGVAVIKRTVSSLETAIRRTGRTIAECAFLAGIAEGRLRAILNGERPSTEEREALQTCVGDWDGSNGPKGGGR